MLRSPEFYVLFSVFCFVISTFIAHATTTNSLFCFYFGLLLSTHCMIYVAMLYSIAFSIEKAVTDAMAIIRHESEKAATKIAVSSASVDKALTKLLLTTLA
jgi:hypothetical protein